MPPAFAFATYSSIQRSPSRRRADLDDHVSASVPASSEKARDLLQARRARRQDLHRPGVPVGC